MLRLTPANGRRLNPTGNMYVWDYKGESQRLREPIRVLSPTTRRCSAAVSAY
ncbi:hypothetical protein GCM10009780_44760 [Actinomadura alba]